MKSCFGLIFYKGTKKENPESLIADNLICKITRSRFSHVELVLYKNKEEDTYKCLSSSFRDKGVRLTDIDIHSGSWEILKLPESKNISLESAFDFYEYNKDRKYDLLGLLCTLSDHLKTNNKNKLFCSELIAEMLDLKLYENQSPERIYKYIIKESGSWQVQ